MGFEIEFSGKGQLFYFLVNHFNINIIISRKFNGNITQFFLVAQQPAIFPRNVFHHIGIFERGEATFLFEFENLVGFDGKTFFAGHSFHTPFDQNHRRTGIFGVGLASVADGLAAVKKLCFDEKSVAPAELLEALKNDFEGAEDAQARLLIELQNLGLMVVSFKESGLALESLYMSLIMESR